MAQTEHLPIPLRAARYGGQVYKAAYDLCLYFEKVVQGFSRYHKYAIGADLRAGSRRVLKLVARANARRDKREVLLQIREEIEEIKVLVRFVSRRESLCELQLLPHCHHADRRHPDDEGGACAAARQTGM